MAYKRGSGTVNVELSRLQQWAENTDVDLYGEYGKPGLVDEHRERMMREGNAKESSDKSSRNLVTLCAIFAAVHPIIDLIKYLHSVWK